MAAITTIDSQTNNKSERKKRMNLILTQRQLIRVPNISLLGLLQRALAIMQKVPTWISSWFPAPSDMTYESWRQLEYRNELCTRVGEKFNPFPIR